MTLLGKNKPLLISLGIHSVLLIAMAIFTLPPNLDDIWYEVSFEYPYVTEEVVKNTSPETVTQAPFSGESQGGARDISRPEQTAQPLNTPTLNPGIPQTGSAEILETPTRTTAKDPSRPVSLGNNPLAMNALRDMARGPATGATSGGVGIAVQGGKVRFSMPEGYRHNLGYGGSVTLQFEIDRYSRVIPGTVVSTQQTEGRIFEAAKKLLMDGSLSVIGEPSSNMKCVITFEFL